MGDQFLHSDVDLERGDLLLRQRQEGRGRGWMNWGEVFQHYASRGEDHASAAEKADAWQRRRARQ